MSDKIPNAVYYLSKDDCEKNYFKECVKLPEGYNREYHDYNNGFTENSAKKTRYNEVKAALNKLKSNQDLNQEEIKKVLVYLLRGVN